MPGRLARAVGKRGSTDPTHNHPFVETNDAGLGAAASGTGGYSGNTANTLGVTTAYLRSTRCAMAGCGKERHDPIHAVATT